MLECGLSDADDLPIWDRCIAEQRVLISKDEDFIILAARPGDQGRLIWVRLGNCRNVALLAAVDHSREPLLEAVAAGQRVIEIR